MKKIVKNNNIIYKVKDKKIYYEKLYTDVIAKNKVFKHSIIPNILVHGRPLVYEENYTVSFFKFVKETRKKFFDFYKKKKKFIEKNKARILIEYKKEFMKREKLWMKYMKPEKLEEFFYNINEKFEIIRAKRIEKKEDFEKSLDEYFEQIPELLAYQEFEQIKIDRNLYFFKKQSKYKFFKKINEIKKKKSPWMWYLIQNFYFSKKLDFFLYINKKLKFFNKTFIYFKMVKKIIKKKYLANFRYRYTFKDKFKHKLWLFLNEEDNYKFFFLKYFAKKRFNYNKFKKIKIYKKFVYDQYYFDINNIRFLKTLAGRPIKNLAISDLNKKLLKDHEKFEIITPWKFKRYFYNKFSILFKKHKIIFGVTFFNHLNIFKKSAVMINFLDTFRIKPYNFNLVFFTNTLFIRKFIKYFYKRINLNRDYILNVVKNKVVFASKINDEKYKNFLLKSTKKKNRIFYIINKRIELMYKFNLNLYLNKFFNSFIKNGKKNIIKNIIKKIINILKYNNVSNAVFFFRRIFFKMRPVIFFKKYHIGKNLNLVPFLNNKKLNKNWDANRRFSTIATRWLIKSIKLRKEKTLILRIVNELIDVIKNRGNSIELKKNFYLSFYNTRSYMRLLKIITWI